MAEENSNVEVSDRGLFGFGKKDEVKKDEVKNEEEGLVTGVQNLRVDESRPVEKKEEEKKGSLLTKLHRSDSSSSSSSSDEEEVGPDGEIKKKKKLREKLKGKFGGDKKDETAHAPTTPVGAAPVTAGHVAKPDNTNVVIEKMDEDVKVEPAKEEEKKGFLEKIKDKLPGHGAKKETAPAFPAPAPPVPVSTSTEEVEGGEKKGLLGKIMDKIPGYHKEEKEADKTAAH